MKWKGHLWTILPTMRGWMPQSDFAELWTGSVSDSVMGLVPLSGKLHRAPLGEDTTNTVRDDSYRKSKTLVVLIHGLGGSADSTYVRDAAQDVLAHGYAAFRLSMRGADGSGVDMYSAGLTADLKAVLQDPAFNEFQEIIVIGFSLGGHIALRAAVEGLDPRVKSVVAIGSPVDLSPGAKALDHASRKLYREYILIELRALYGRLAARGRNHTPMERINQIKSLREFDALTIVPRFGFHDVEDYYAKSSVAPILPDLSIPSLYIGSSHDPMIPKNLVEPWLTQAGPNLHSVWVDDGGHVYFPGGLDLDFGGEKGVIRQALQWVENHT